MLGTCQQIRLSDLLMLFKTAEDFFFFFFIDAQFHPFIFSISSHSVFQTNQPTNKQKRSLNG
jgi:hypothetical protein